MFKHMDRQITKQQKVGETSNANDLQFEDCGLSWNTNTMICLCNSDLCDLGVLLLSKHPIAALSATGTPFLYKHVPLYGSEFMAVK